MNEKKPHPSEKLEFETIPIGLSEQFHTRGDERCTSEHHDPTPSIRSSTSVSGDEIYRGVSSHSTLDLSEFDSLVQESKAATDAEHVMTFTEAVNLYPKAICWSILLSLTIVMEGFDITLMNSFFAFPSFKARYGEPTGNGDYEITTNWQSAMAGTPWVGEILGLLLSGLLTDRIGNRRTMILSLGMLSGFVLLSFFAQNKGMLLASQLLSGIPWGVFQTLTTTYAAEVMPVALRAYLTSIVNLCWLVGQVISSGLLRAFANNMSEWSYRIPFALQWAWAVPILIGILFAPESPWWLVQHGRFDEAKRSLLRLTQKKEKFNADGHIAMMRHTTEVERYFSSLMMAKDSEVADSGTFTVSTTSAMNIGTSSNCETLASARVDEHSKGKSSKTSYLDCFKGTDLRRTEIACMVWATQAICGVMTGYAAYFYSEAGLATDKAFDLTLAMYCSGIVGTLFSWLLMQVAGRRTLYLYGNALCFLCLLAAGIVGTLPSSATVSWSLGSLILAVTFIYDSTVGPVCYSLVAEIPSARLRVKTVVLARITYNAISLITNILMPMMLNPTAGDWKGKTCLPFAGLAGLCFVWCYYRLPEPKGLTFIELDLLFDKRANAKKFGEVRDNLVTRGYFGMVWGEKRKGERRGGSWCESKSITAHSFKLATA